LPHTVYVHTRTYCPFPSAGWHRLQSVISADLDSQLGVPNISRCFFAIMIIIF